MSRFLLFLALCFVCSAAEAQDFIYGETNNQTLSARSYALDPSAHALMVDEYGNSSIHPSDFNMVLVHIYHAKIKIFDHKGFEDGTIEIPLYSGMSADSIVAQTTYLDDKGQVKTIELDPHKIYHTNNSQGVDVLRFAMPGLQEGCVIEYKYRLFSNSLEFFHTWMFQGFIPKVRSRYEFSIPGFYHYNALLRGSIKINNHISNIYRDCIAIDNYTRADCGHHIYEMDDIPAFVGEDFMTSPKNYMSGLYFELTDYVALRTGAKVKVAKEWKDIDNELKHSSWFGDQMDRKGLFKDKIAPFIAGKTDSLEKAKAVYAYILKNIKWNDVDAPLSYYGIHKAVENHTGSSADINLSLISALDAAGLKANAVLLATRPYGFVNKLYPSYGNFNYVIAMVTVGGINYFLDATEKTMPFGTLPLKCMNDQGRVMSLNKPSYWIDINTGQKKSSSYTFDLTLQKDGKVTGTMTRYSGSYDGYERRKAIKKFNTIDEFIDSQESVSQRFQVSKSHIDNLDSLDMPLSETYHVEIKAYDNLKADRIVFDPVFLDTYKVNPLKMAERTYPVDYGMPATERLTLTLHIPDGFTVDELPKDIGFTLPGDGGKFICGFQNNDNTITFTRIIQLNKPAYTAGEYLYLKEFYNKIILSQNLGITVKKKG